MRLYPRLLLWLALNLALISALFMALPGRAGLGWELLLTDSAREHLLDLGGRLSRELSAAQDEQWPAILAKASDERGLRFAVEDRFGPSRRMGAPPGPPPGFGPSGPPPGADDRPPPPPFGEPSGGPPPDRGPMSAPADRSVMADMIELQRGRGFGDYRLRIPARRWRDGVDAGPLDIRVEIDGLGPLLRLLGIGDWALFALLSVALSAMLWWPFMVGITRAVVAVTRATERIADGRFDARVELRRRDELGQLAAAVNRMAARLDNQLRGQKQFVADVAHEVTSPLARLRIGLGLLEPQLGPSAASAFADIQDDAEQMSALLDELLLFSRAGLTGAQSPPERLALATLVREALEREDALDRVELQLPAGLSLLGHRALLVRALANLVRNALRYGHAPVSIEAGLESGELRVYVRDCGLGVPPEALPRLGEPFYRPDAARDRDSGGTGLGLAIVRRCVEAGEGTVHFRNREGGGFEAELRLKIG